MAAILPDFTTSLEAPTSAPEPKFSLNDIVNYSEDGSGAGELENKIQALAYDTEQHNIVYNIHPLSDRLPIGSEDFVRLREALGYGELQAWRCCASRAAVGEDTLKAEVVQVQVLGNQEAYKVKVEGEQAVRP